MPFTESKFRDDSVFQVIERDYLTLDDDECKRNSELLKMIVEENFIHLMKRDKLFATIFNRVVYGGSYYKGTKYGRPNEFDLYLVHKLDNFGTDLMIDSDYYHPGYVKIMANYRNSGFLRFKEELEKMTDFNNYLDHEKFRAWLEGVFTKAFETLPSASSASSNSRNMYRFSLKKTGPAFTLTVKAPNDTNVFDVDLVPAIEFNSIHLGSEYKNYNKDKRPCFVISKPLYKSIPNDNLFWRLSFSENEKNILSGELKPVIKMMKKFRDTQDLNSIKSYFIETIFYHELENHKYHLGQFERSSKTQLFIHGLRKLREALKNGKLPYFWHERLDLFQKMSRNELENHANRLGSILDDIERQIGYNKLILKKYICGTS